MDVQVQAQCIPARFPCLKLHSPSSWTRSFSYMKLHSSALKARMSIRSRLEENFTVLDGLKHLCQPPSHKVWLLDQFGVLHDGQKPYDGAIETLKLIADTNVKLIIISNSSRRAESTYKRLASLGFDTSLFFGVITSGELTHEYLQRRHDPWFAELGQRCLHITWKERGSISLEGLDLEVVENPESADFVLAHGTEALRMENGDIKSASLDEIEAILSVCARRNLPLVVANPDHVTVEARDLKVMPGTLGLKYENLGGHVQYMGKPYPLRSQAQILRT
ncbi:hypothetical protein KP509_01G100700 [Ceratopteris richardii]|uniref:Uncharacterized protein n=1 Tax=Ceratopteris richardii TaxID=49495 RepID=A0A8T2VJN3_CERRI|nr:hypothetical protein KP509_01G100700 [Ceratopteris richardii]